MIKGFYAFFISVFVLLLSSPVFGEEYHDELLKIVDKDHEIEFRVEIAHTPQMLATGLMHRKNMPENAGMLFCFGREKPVFMWMKNTILPLDMIFIRQDGTIASIVENTLPFSEEIIASTEAVSFVLELNAGTVSKFNIKNEYKVKHSSILSCV